MRIFKYFPKFAAIGQASDAFDPKFYLSHYEDLKSLKTAAQARFHYVSHGQSEGRFPNESAFRAYSEKLLAGLNPAFDATAYRLFNRDLARIFSSDEELTKHFIRHGHREPRKYYFSDDGQKQEVLSKGEKWQAAFRTADFLAWIGDRVSNLPKSRIEAIELFKSRGIDEIWPISFDMAFDVQFVQENKLMPSHADLSSKELYRAWLQEGFPTGVAPNETCFLYAYLGGLPFPLGFDWKTFIEKAGLPAPSSRSRALIALFEMSAEEALTYIDLFGENAQLLLNLIGRNALISDQFSKAVTLFRAANKIVPSSDTLLLLGDALQKTGEVEAALSTYLLACNADQPPLWALVHSVNLLASRGYFVQAFDALRQAHESWRHKAEFGQLLGQTVAKYFESQSALAHKLYGESINHTDPTAARALVDAMMVNTLETIRGLFCEMDSLPSSTGGNPDGPILILANLGLPQCTYYRVQQKLHQFEMRGIPYLVISYEETEYFLSNLVGARSAIFYRTPALPDVIKAIVHANSLGLETYYEIDDLIFDASVYPDSYSSFEGQISEAEYAGLQFGVPLFRFAMAMCAGSIASTPALAEQMKAVTATPKNLIVRNGLDHRNDSAILIGANRDRSATGPVRVFYGSGTKAHNADFNNLVAPALLRLMHEYEDLELVIVGHLAISPMLEPYGARITKLPLIKDVENYWSILAGCDINLAVLESGTVADCKSEIKWLEAAVQQVPSVVSGTRTYRELIHHGEDGFIADTPEEWYFTLRKLVADPELRANIGAKARQKALLEYDLAVNAGILANEFTPARPVSSVKRKIRILVCNVFYAPQSYGGATRVVQDNVHHFSESFPDLEVAVFCSDEGFGTTGNLRLTSEDGIPVYRLATPLENRMDWRPFNDEHSDAFEKVLDHFQPDLIHFHCIQRLTATIVEVALKRRIPYVVTLHDGWWISDNQFLVDPDGLLQLPTRDVLADCRESPNFPESVARRQRLVSLLHASKGNLSVSKPFADIYSAAGVRNLQVVENGTPEIAHVPRTQRLDGRVALGHIGGRSPHKGASLIEAALRQGDFQHLHLTMIDGHLPPGSTVETIWGTTPVTLSAPFAQSEVYRLYAKLDVLLAPSTWPESFGLVTREALASGLWVVASDLGAIGENVIEGLNGHLVDVSTTYQLKQAFELIEKNPGKYRSLPFVGLDGVRTNFEQARDLHSLYSLIHHNQKNTIIGAKGD